MTQLLYPWERDPLPIVQEGWWAWGLVWWGTDNLTPCARVQTSGCPVHSVKGYPDD